MRASTATVHTPSVTLTADAHTTAIVAAAIAMRSASAGVSAPDGSGRSGCAMRSMSTSAMSFQEFAAAVSAMAASAASAIDCAFSTPPHPAHHAPTTTPAAAVSAFAHRANRSEALTASGEGARIEALVFRDDVLERKACMRIGRGRIAHRAPRTLIAKDRDPRRHHSLHVAHRAEHTGDAVANDLRQPTHIGGDHRHAARERLERTQAERLVEAWQQKELSTREQRRDGVDLAEKEDGALDAEQSRFLFRLGAIGTVAYHKEHAGHLALNPGEDAHDIAHALDRPEIRDVQDDALPFTRLLSQHLLVARALIDQRIDEVVDDLDLALSATEGGDRLPLKIFRDRSETVRALDRELRDRAERGILANERDVGALQRRDDLHRAAGILEHLARDPRARCMRDRVVRVHELEIVIAHDFVNAHREREIVGRILEERIADDIHLVIENPGGEAAQAEGLLVRDEVDLVAARRERYAELRRDGAGSAVRGIAGDADLHASTPPSSVAFHQRIACSSASGAPGSIIVTRFAGSWCLNQVRCRFAYCRVSVRTFANASSREHSFATAARIHL